MSNRLVIIGDSFASPVNDESFYGFILQERFPWMNVINDGSPSRDAQTIIDHWIKVISELTHEDCLIVVFPMLGRTRLPITENHWKEIRVGNKKLINRFKGTDSYHNEDIEFFGDKFDREYFRNLSVPQIVINASKSSEDNFIEIVESLIHLTKAKKYIFCWEDMERSDIPFDDRKELTKKMGKWITLNTEFINTRGEKGFKEDLHWCYETHLAFADFISKEFELDKKRMI